MFVGLRCRLTLKYVVRPCLRRRTMSASLPSPGKSSVAYSARPSSNESLLPLVTVFTIWFSLSSCEKVIAILSSFVEENSASESSQQYDAHKSVGSKKSGVQATEIVGVNKSMLVDKQSARGDHACEGDWSKTRDHKEPDQTNKRPGMKRPCDPECACDSEARRNGSQSFTSIKIVILACIQHVESGGPQEDHERQQQRYRTSNLATHRDPRAEIGRASCRERV